MGLCIGTPMAGLTVCHALEDHHHLQGGCEQYPAVSKPTFGLKITHALLPLYCMDMGIWQPPCSWMNLPCVFKNQADGASFALHPCTARGWLERTLGKPGRRS